MDWGMVIASFIGTFAALILFILIILFLFGSKIRKLYGMMKGLGNHPLLGGITEND